jgi:hypothetical protein
VKVCQHHSVHGQHGMEEERHRRNHPRHQKAEEYACVPRLMTDGFAGMGEDGRTSLVRLIRHISSKQLVPYPSSCALTGRNRSREWEPSVPHFLDLDLLGAMVQQEARSRGTPEKCGGGRR